MVQLTLLPLLGAVDTAWHAPRPRDVNNLTAALRGPGVYGFIYNSSHTPAGRYGAYNACNMPHVRPAEYERAPPGFELQYVELMHRHHKRSPYAANSFPLEPDAWDCDDARLFAYAQPRPGPAAARAHRRAYASPVNPFAPAGWTGSCLFPQITAGGLGDSWFHGADLYAVYHDLLHLLPDRGPRVPPAVRYCVTNNAITSQVAAMVAAAMWLPADPVPLLVQADAVDSLEPQYPCPAASSLFASIKSDANPPWRRHLDDAAHLLAALDRVSRVPPADAAFHASFDHYYDNLSARQCHARPLPCDPLAADAYDASNASCISQDLADAVYRMGHWEYSYVYRDHPSSLAASAASLGVWIGELTTHLRDFMAGSTDVVYFHNVAHDGSLSRLLSVLQVDDMVWPGMGAEVVFELYKRTAASAAAAATTPASTKSFYLRVLFGGRVLRSSSPTLGLMDMVPVNTVLDYLDGLVGKRAGLVKSKCQAQTP